MSHPPEIRALAFELYLAGRAPEAIAAELARRNPGAEAPSAKTIEKWAYQRDGEAKTWSERRSEALSLAQAAVQKDFVSAKTRMIQGVLALQQKLEARALQAADAADIGNFSQECYAFLNATKSAGHLLDSDIAEQVRAKDAIDLLIEAVRRTVPGFAEQWEERVRLEFKRLVAEKESKISSG
jgi:hypothetical protein